MAVLTQERLKEVLQYNPETGEFFWRPHPARYKRPDKIGQRAGGVDHNGYWCIRIDRRLYWGHRLAWLYVHGYVPKQLDHIDRTRSDCRIANLRISTKSENAANSKKHKDNRSGFKGVTQVGRRWVAQVGKGNQNTYLGCFDTPQEAHRAYCEAARELHGNFFNPD